MAEQKRDLEGLIEFLNLFKKGGYFKPGTANNRINIAQKVLGTVPDIGNDLTKIDVEDVYGRYARLNPGILPATLRGNKPHFKSAIAEFTSYLADTVNYKPKTGSTKATIAKASSQKAASATKPTATETPKPEIPVTRQNTPSAPTIHIDFQIHITPDTDPSLVEKIFESLSKYFPSGK